MSNNLVNGNIVLDLESKRLFVDGVEKFQGTRRLSRINFLLLKFFIENRGRNLTKEDILLAVWGKGYIDRESNLRVQIGVIRQLLGDARPYRLIINEIYLGYRMVNLTVDERICEFCGQLRAK